MALTPRRIRFIRRSTPVMLVLYAVGGVWLMSEDEAVVRFGGACAIGASAILSWIMWRPAGRGLPAEPVTGGLLLPGRAASRRLIALALILTAFAALGLGIYGLNDGDPLFGRRSPSHAFLATIVYGAMGPVMLGGAALGRGRLRLDPSGVSYQPLMGRSRFIAWRDINKVELDAVWGIAVVMRAKFWSGAKTIGVPLHFQTWPGEAVADAIKWYAGHAGARQNLTDPEALERWRPQPEWD